MDRLQLDLKNLPDGVVARLKELAHRADVRLNAYCRMVLVREALGGESPQEPTLQKAPWEL